ncbi:MAG: hypothetical protein QOH94_1682, partial [Mycobacterium sp.]|nr:hypothetical protein [Mycobacterium sp.]
MRTALLCGEEPDKCLGWGASNTTQSERQYRRMAEFIYTMKKVR